QRIAEKMANASRILLGVGLRIITFGPLGLISSWGFMEAPLYPHRLLSRDTVMLYSVHSWLGLSAIFNLHLIRLRELEACGDESRGLTFYYVIHVQTEGKTEGL
ncbi:MAG TPA: hypothetical protein VE715_17155, partial [Blastocatellia bacterium]|nr:hypothetical protein [Blastocatellia bacterium]